MPRPLGRGAQINQHTWNDEGFSPFLMKPIMRIITARTAEHYSAAVELFNEYAHGLGIDLTFQNFNAELADLPQKYGPPTGELWLVQDGEKFVGCAALRKLEVGVCELKRMYIQPACRGQKAGNQLVEMAIDCAKSLGYQTIKLDSLRRLTPAIKLYERYGFAETTPYNYNPEADVVYFERSL
jgi:putative acetyltransferase